MSNYKKMVYLLDQSNTKRGVFILLFLFVAVSSLMEVVPSEILGKFSTLLINLSKDEGISKLIEYGILYFVSILSGTVVRNIFCYATSRVSNSIIKRIRDLAYAKLLSVDLDCVNELDTGYCINMVNGNTERLESVFSTALFTLLSDLFDLIWISVFIYAIDWKLLVIMCAFIPPLYYMGLKSSNAQKKYAVSRINLETKIIRQISEAFVNLPIIRIFEGQSRENYLFAQLTDQYKRECNRADVSLSMFFVAEKGLRYIAISLVLFFAAYGIVSGTYEEGALVTIVLYSQRFYSPITNIIKYLQMLQKGMASVDSLHGFLTSKNGYTYKNILFDANEQFISVDGLKVESDESVILPESNIRIYDKKLNIIRGESGAGKTTLLKALLGMIPASNGIIRVNSDLEKMKLFSYASQNAEIFSGTILENVLYPKSAETAASEDLMAAETILRQLGFPDKLHYRDVGEAGNILSGGERKRIAFARAILRSSRVLLLDEITSNMDAENQKIIENLIAEQCEKRCVVLITHKQMQSPPQSVTITLGKEKLL